MSSNNPVSRQVTLSAQTTIQLQQPELANFPRMPQILWVMWSSQAFRSMDQWKPEISNLNVDLNNWIIAILFAILFQNIKTSKHTSFKTQNKKSSKSNHGPNELSQFELSWGIEWKNWGVRLPTQTSAAKVYSQAATSGAQYSGDPKTSVKNAPSSGGHVWRCGVSCDFWNVFGPFGCDFLRFWLWKYTKMKVSLNVSGMFISKWKIVQSSTAESSSWPRFPSLWSRYLQ